MAQVGWWQSPRVMEGAWGVLQGCSVSPEGHAQAGQTGVRSPMGDQEQLAHRLHCSPDDAHSTGGALAQRGASVTTTKHSRTGGAELAMPHVSAALPGPLHCVHPVGCCIQLYPPPGGHRSPGGILQPSSKAGCDRDRILVAGGTTGITTQHPGDPQLSASPNPAWHCWKLRVISTWVQPAPSLPGVPFPSIPKLIPLGHTSLPSSSPSQGEKQHQLSQKQRRFQNRKQAAAAAQQRGDPESTALRITFPASRGLSAPAAVARHTSQASRFPTALRASWDARRDVNQGARHDVSRDARQDAAED